MKEERYDVLVIGAGPAGSVTAKTVAEKGLDVLLIERNTEIGLPVKCAEFVSRHIERFVDTDPRWICAMPKGIIIYGPGGSQVRLLTDGSDAVGYVLERRLFDKSLAQQAAHTGAEVRVKTRAYDVIKKDGYVKGVYVNSAGEDMRIFADVVVGADGVESYIGRWSGIDTRLRLTEISTCAQFLICNVEVDNDNCKPIFDSTIAPRGYAWIFPKGDGLANVGLGIGGDISGEGHRALDYLRAFVNDRFPDGQVLAEMYGVIPMSGPVFETVMNWLVLVGDAARHVNPITGGGILQAVQGGAIAGDVIAKAVYEKNVSRRRLLEYEKRWKREFGKALEVGFTIWNIIWRISSQDQVRFFREMAGEIRMKEFHERTFLKEMIKKNPWLLFRFARLIF